MNPMLLTLRPHSKNCVMKTRRDFIKSTAVAGAAFSILPSSIVFSKSPESKVRLGFIGVGARGQNHLELALDRDDVEVVAICDIQQRMIDMSLGLVANSGKTKPQIILDGPQGYKKLLENKDIDAVNHCKLPGRVAYAHVH